MLIQSSKKWPWFSSHHGLFGSTEKSLFGCSTKLVPFNRNDDGKPKAEPTAILTIPSIGNKRRKKKGTRKKKENGGVPRRNVVRPGIPALKPSALTEIDSVLWSDFVDIN